MGNLRDKVFKLLEMLETSTSMIVPEPQYSNSKWFIWGCFWAMEDATGIPVHNEITKWLHVKTGEVTSLRWLEHIYYHVANQDEELAFQITKDYLREFLEENADTLFAEKES